MTGTKTGLEFRSTSSHRDEIDQKRKDSIVIESIEGMPAGAVGFRASGKVTADDYRTVLEPAIKVATETGEIRMLYVLEDDVDLDLGAMGQDAKTGLAIGVGHHSAWVRSAVVTDVEWLRRAMHLFSWMVPGEFKLFGTADLAEAESWVAGAD